MKRKLYLTNFKTCNISPLGDLFFFLFGIYSKGLMPFWFVEQKSLGKLRFTYDVTYKSCDPIKEKHHAKYIFLI
mgnify:CR=1 FL=1